MRMLSSFASDITGNQYVECKEWLGNIYFVSASRDAVTPRNRLYAKPPMLKENETHWFPMRIRNSSLTRLEEMQKRLDACQEITATYAPLHFIRVSMTKMDFAKYLLNYIFVRSTFASLVKVKSNQELFEPLRFVVHPEYDDKFDAHRTVLTISDKKMDDYMRITEEENKKVIFLNNMDYVCRKSQEVQITEGQFAGVLGRIKRIGGNRCVVVPIGREMAVGVMDVPRSCLRYLTADEISALEAEECAPKRRLKFKKVTI